MFELAHGEDLTEGNEVEINSSVTRGGMTRQKHKPSCLAHPAGLGSQVPGPVLASPSRVSRKGPLLATWGVGCGGDLRHETRDPRGET